MSVNLALIVIPWIEKANVSNEIKKKKQKKKKFHAISITSCTVTSNFFFRKTHFKCSHVKFVIFILDSRESGGEGGESDERLEGFRIFPRLICTCEHLKWFYFIYFLFLK